MALTPEERKRIAVCLTTQYHGFERNRAVNVRGKLAQKLIRDTVDGGYTTIIVDGKSDALFLDNIADVLPKTIFSVQTREGFSQSRREALETASHVPDLGAVIMTEPEKTDMAEYELHDRLAEPILSGKADITVLNRTAQTFETMSPYQAESERAANMILNDLLRGHGLLKPDDRNLDLFSGPKAISPEAMHLFQRVWGFNHRIDLPSHEALKDEDLDVYANALFFPVYQALKDGLRVVPVTVALQYPTEQIIVEHADTAFKQKRDRQRRTIIMQSIEFLRKLSEGQTRFHLKT